MKRLNLNRMTEFWNLIDSQPESVKNVVIDLSNFNFITHSALVGLASLLEYYLKEKKEKISVILPNLDDEFINNFEILKPMIGVNQTIYYNFVRKNYLSLSYESFVSNLQNLSFASFLKTTYFIDIWKHGFTENRVEFINYQSGVVEDSFFYRGRKREEDLLYDPDKLEIHLSGEHLRYSLLHRISGSFENRKSSLKSIINNLYEKLPDDQKKSPLFLDNEFSEIFLESLSDNVANHVQDSRAYIIARSFSKEDISKKLNIDRLIPDLEGSLKNICKLNGFFEINISDNGIGIENTLSEAYKSVLCNIVGHNKSFLAEDVIAFSFDEYGSRYLKNSDKFKALIEEHCLNKIFKYTIKYGGHIRLLSNNICLNYDTSKAIKRGKFGFGFEGDKANIKYFQKGLNIRIILPHVSFYNCNYPKARYLKWMEEVPAQNKLPYAFYCDCEFTSIPTANQLNEKIAELSELSIKKKIDKIAIDLTGTEDWNVEIFNHFLEKIQNLSSNIICWGINLPVEIIEKLKNNLDSLNKNIPFVAIDKTENKELYLLSKETLKISKGLSIIFKDQIDNYQRNILEPRSLDEIKLTINDVDGVYLDDEKLISILSFSSNVIQYDEKIKGWYGIITYSEMINSAYYVLQKNFLDLLIKTKSIIKGNDDSDPRKKIFLLPSSENKVDEYIWTYNLLQYGHHTNEIAIRIKNLFYKYYISKDFDLISLKTFEYIVCVTAPARIAAEAISKKFEHAPLVIDLGGVNQLDPDDLLESISSDKQIECIIVTDVLDTGNLIKRIIRLLISKNIKIIGIAALIKFEEIIGNKWIGAVKEEKFIIDDRELILPVGVLYQHQKPNRVDCELDENKHKLFIIEPYSLKPYLSDALYEEFFAWENYERERKYPERILNLDKKGCLMYGHFKDRNHHNKIFLQMIKTLQDDELSDDICGDIIEFISRDIPAVIIVPLHSNIHYLTPKLRVKLRERNIAIPIICTIAVDLKGRGPFYILPDEARNILLKAKEGKATVLFLDDGISSGRTVETFFRAVRDFKRREPREIKRSIDKIFIYCILNRLGRAGSTKWHEIRQVLEKTKFEFREYVRFECPVYSSNDCPICKEIDRFKNFSIERYSSESRVNDWVSKKLKKGTIINSKEFREYAPKFFSSVDNYRFLQLDSIPKTKRERMTDENQINLVSKMKLTSLEGCLWWMNERSFRGTPIDYLAKEFMKFINSINDIEIDIKERLYSEFLLWCADNLDDFKSPIASKIAACQDEKLNANIMEILNAYLKSGSKLIPDVLEKISHHIFKRKTFKASTNDYINIFKNSIEAITVQEDADKVLNIILGIYLMIINLKKEKLIGELKDIIKSVIYPHLSKKDKWEGHYRNLLQFIDSENANDEYLYSLRLLCQEKYKKRHQYVFNIKRSMLRDIIDVKKHLGHLIDYLPKIMHAIDITLKSECKNNKNIETEIEIFKSCAKEVLRLLKSENANKFKEKIVDNLLITEHYLKGKSTEIGRKLDFYHPKIYEVMQLLIEETKIESCNEIDFNRIILLNNNNRNINIIGDRILLRDTIKNNTIDILKKWQNSDIKIGIQIENDGIVCKIKMYYQNISVAQGKERIRKGTTFGMFNYLWERYGGKIIEHQESDLTGFLSYITIVLQIGFIGGTDE